MNVLSFIDFLTFVIYLYIGVYVLCKNPDEPINRVFFGVISCFAIWAFATIFLHAADASKETAMLSINIASIGWISFGSFVLLFFLIFTEKDKILQSRWLYPVLIVVPVIFIYQQWMNQSLISDLIPQWYGWGLLWKNSAWTFLFFSYYIIFTGIGLVFGFDYWQKANDPIVKHQTVIVFLSAFLPYVLGSWTNVLLPELHIYCIPPVAHLLLMLWVCGIAYVIIRYRFLTITPATAAENILSTMTEVLILTDPMGRIITVNKATVDMLGYKKEELEGIKSEKVFASKQDAAPLWKALSSKEAVRNEEFRFITKEGKSVPVILSATLLKDDRENIAGIIYVARDISELIEMQKKMLAVYKLESIRSLAGGIAHEYNNKLSVLSCNVDLLRLKMAGNQVVEKNLEPMSVAISQISGLTSQLVAYAQEGKYQPAAIDINDLVDATLPVFQYSGNDDIHIEKSLGINLSKVFADFGQIQMVLHIILSNASEAIQGNGRIQISVNDVEISGEDAQSHTGFRPGHYVRLMVIDDGKGMDGQTLKQIFDPFFSTKVQGRGLGMAAVYGIVKNHDGFIDVVSRIDKGTSVRIFLPVVKDKDTH